MSTQVSREDLPARMSLRTASRVVRNFLQDSAYGSGTTSQAASAAWRIISSDKPCLSASMISSVAMIHMSQSVSQRDSARKKASIVLNRRPQKAECCIQTFKD